MRGLWRPLYAGSLHALPGAENQRVFAIKGKGGDGIPFVTPPSKVAIKDNKRITCWLYTFGVDAGKEAIMSNIKVQEPGAKYCHFPRGERLRV